MNCNFCNLQMEEKKSEQTFIPVGNPVKLKIMADFLKCTGCGKEIFGQMESLRISKIVDKVNSKLDQGEQIESIQVPDGVIIC